MHVQSIQSCLTLRAHMDCRLPGSSVHGILQARILDRVAMPSSRGSSNPGIESPVSPALHPKGFLAHYYIYVSYENGHISLSNFLKFNFQLIVTNYTFTL